MDVLEATDGVRLNLWLLNDSYWGHSVSSELSRSAYARAASAVGRW